MQERKYLSSSGKEYYIPTKSDLKKEGIVVPIGNTLMIMISDDILFDTGITPSKVHSMSDDEFNDLVYEKAVAFIKANERKT